MQNNSELAQILRLGLRQRLEESEMLTPEGIGLMLREAMDRKNKGICRICGNTAEHNHFEQDHFSEINKIK